MNKYDKEFKTFKEQKELLNDKYKLKFIEENKAEQYLTNFPYYNIINGYQDHFRINNQYNDITLEKLITIHLLDKSFLAIILKYITFIEDNFKHKMSYVISSKGYEYVSNSTYLDKSNQTLYNKIPEKSVIDTMKNTIKKPKYNPTLYYKENHNHIPIWILLKNIFFKNSIEYYKLLNTTIKLEIINYFEYFNNLNFNIKKNKNKKTNKLYNIKNKKIELFQHSLETLKEYRNSIVHNQKVFKKTVDKRFALNLKLFNGDLISILKNDKHINGDLYSCIFTIIFLLDHKLLIRNFILDINNTLRSTNEDVFYTYINMYNLPENFLEILENINLYFNNK